MTDAPTLDDIRQAYERIKPLMPMTPLAGSEYISRLWGRKILFKLENLQVTGSFKERGALNKLLQLPPDMAKRGVITASAGNHGQAVAHRAETLGMRATIVMPEYTPLIKVQNCRSFGATIILHGANFDDATAHARKLCEERGMVYVHGFDDFDIVAGQGTLALEILEQNPEIDCVVIPIGGGGLAAGAAIALKAIKPGIRIVGVEVEGFPSMKSAIEAGHPIMLPPRRTIADGIAVRSAGQLPFEILSRLVDEIVTVSEEEIAQAILLMLEREKTVVEGAGAAGVAAMHNKRVSRSGERVVVVLSGGNIDVNLLSRVIDKGLVRDGRLIKIRVVVLDYPGQLSRVLDIVAHSRANVLEVSHTRAFSPAQLGETSIELVLETRGDDHIEEMLQRLREHEIEPERIY